MSFSSEVAADVVATLTEFGELLTFTRTTKGAYSQATGKRSNTSGTYAKVAYGIGAATKEKGGEIVLAGDETLLAEAHTYQVEDTVVIDGDIWRIIQIRKIKAEGNLVAAYLDIRR